MILLEQAAKDPLQQHAEQLSNENLLMHSTSHTVQRVVNCFLGGFDNIASECNWMSFVYMFPNKFPVTLHLGMWTLGCLFMTEKPDIWPVASIWPQSCCKVLLPVSSQSASQSARHCESAPSEAVLPTNKQAEVQLSQLPVLRCKIPIKARACHVPSKWKKK